VKHRSIFFLFCWLFWGHAQQSNDPKVGLILSGGGAKGMAHVGVLKEIERAGVRIDYIGGTSMGAIVGGLYACGYSAQQLEQLLTETDFNDLVNDKFPRNHKSFTEKEDSERYSVTLPITAGKIQFPLALSKGQRAFDFLVQLTYEQRNSTDFSQLPIPFYCVATDMDTGEKVVLEKGFLPLAINASSALPTVFSPVKINDRMLIDGGVADNYPIDEMLQKGVDVIIGVDVQTSVDTEQAPTTFSEVLVRISGFQTAKLMGPKKAKTDIYIKPEVHQYNLLAFAEQPKIIAKGEDAAKKVFPQLKQLAQKQKSSASIPKKIPTTFRLDRVDIAATPNYKTNYLLGKIRLKSGKEHPFSKLRKGMSTLAATQNFDTFRYTLATQNEQETLSLTLNEPPHKSLFRAGIQYNGFMGASALVNITQKHALLKNDEISLDLIFGQFFRYAFTYFIDKGRFWSIGLSASMDQFETEAPFVVRTNEGTSVFTASNTDVLVQKNTFYVQTLFREKAVLGAGIGHQRNIFTTNLYDNLAKSFLSVDDADYYKALGYLKIDTRDNGLFPKKGGFFDGSIAYYFSQKTRQLVSDFTPFFIGKAKMGIALPISKKWTLNLNTMGGFTIGNANTPSFDFYFGGYGNAPLLNYQSFVGLTQQYVGGDSFVKGVMELDYEFIPRHHIRALLHTGIIQDDIFDSGDWIKKPDYFGTALAYGLESFLGPIECTASYSPQYRRMVYYVNLGWQF
jgi:NTE family protein